jgi:hypothetical protein
MKKYSVLIVLAVLFNGCVMERMAKNPVFKAKVCNACGGRDTFRVEVKDTIIQTETDTAWQTIELGCDSLGEVFVKDIKERDGEILRLMSQLKNGRLTVRATKEKEYIFVPRVKTREYRSTTIEVPTPFIPVKYKILFWILIPFAILGLIVAVRWFIKDVLPKLITAVIKGFKFGI